MAKDAAGELVRAVREPRLVLALPLHGFRSGFHLQNDAFESEAEAEFHHARFHRPLMVSTFRKGPPTIHDNRKHSSHCGILVKSPNEPPMPWRVRPRSVSSLCPCHLDLDPPPRHTPRPPRSTTTAITQHTAETLSNLQTNLRCHGVFARAAYRRSVLAT